MTGAGPGWYVYIVRCADGTLYTGVAIDVSKRVAQHNGVHAVRQRGVRAVGSAGKRAVRKVRDSGARYTRARRPVKLVYQENAANRSAACRREYRIKQLTRREKLALIAAGSRIISAVSKNRE